MKEMSFKSKEETKEVRNVQQEKKQVLVGQIKPKRGHTLFEFNLRTKTIKKAEFEQSYIVFNKFGSKPNAINRKVMVAEDCVYISALNEKNALKKLFR